MRVHNMRYETVHLLLGEHPTLVDFAHLINTVESRMSWPANLVAVMRKDTLRAILNSMKTAVPSGPMNPEDRLTLYGVELHITDKIGGSHIAFGQVERNEYGLRSYNMITRFELIPKREYTILDWLEIA